MFNIKGSKMKIMNKVVLIILITIVLYSCSNTSGSSKKELDSPDIKKYEVLNDSIENESSSSVLQTNEKVKEVKKVVPDNTIFENFEVVYLDYHRDWLQRIFVVIKPDNVYDTLIINSVICELKSLFEVDSKSNISFFSDKKYADYKDKLFTIKGHLLPKDKYDNWMNYYYLAEFDFETNNYKTFPSCRTDYKRQRTIKIKCE